MRLLTNPLVLRMGIVFFAASIAFLVGLFTIRQLKQGIQEDAKVGESKDFADNFPLHTYHAVIQQLKQQKHELQALQQSERRRAQTSENLSAAVLSNLSCGVLFFNGNGLVRQSNPAAKNILGVASPVGMNARELFRDAGVEGGLNSAETPLAEAIDTSLKTFAKFEGLEANYSTPQGEDRVLQVTVSPVYGVNAEVLGAACLIHDCTEISRMKRTQEAGQNVPVEIAQRLKDSLVKLLADSKNLAANQDAQASGLAEKVAIEAESLQQQFNAFLSGRNAMRTASGKN